MKTSPNASGASTQVKNMHRRRIRAVSKSAGGFLGLLLISWLLHGSGFIPPLDTQWVEQHVRDRGLEGVLLFLLAGAMFTAVGLPRQAMAFLAGYAFGFGLGCSITVLATTLGCVPAFAYARLFSASPVLQAVQRRLPSVGRYVRHRPFLTTLLARLSPVGSNLVTNLVAGIYRVPLPAFLFASALGFVPQSLIFALLGDGGNVSPTLRFVGASALFVACLLLGTRLFKHQDLPPDDMEPTVSNTPSQ
ncbi:TVP38/TMEM64 family protein [Pseudomonas sp. NFIX28]|uniref:TVP38/TMEM64 family protein n=1 Tax=Pseudomonas sp. NFIX28 TaxID=1566235 RepID=UPI00158754C3|nr:VTT domain-containing protein [Pseudomonas sp. NFIX28]